jgi:Lectin C-type domain
VLQRLHLLASRNALACFAAFALLLGCTTTLDPTHLELASCSSADIASSRYFLCSTALDYADAAQQCALRGASLAAITSAEQNAAVADAAFAKVNVGNVWIGGTRSDAFVWSWPDGSVFWQGVQDGAAEPGAFVLWQPGEPNNSSSTTGGPERCLALTVENSDWVDRSCSLSLPFVCESAP